MSISASQWQFFYQNGYLPLGRVIAEEVVDQLKQQADALALGHISNPDVLIQRDTGGDYLELPSALPQGSQNDLLYRKINGLENDAEFRKLLTLPIVLEIFSELYGPHAKMSTFRAMIMNKPANQGTELPWHQDGGTVWQLDRDPLMTFWVALDDADQQNGCVEALAGSHKLGLLSTFGSTVASEDIDKHYRTENHHYLEVAAGHGVLIHNWLIHRSGVNRTAEPRRAFTACFLDARTTNLQTGEFFPMVSDTPPPTPHFIEVLQAAILERTHAAAEAERYALSLAAELEKLRQSPTSAKRFLKR